MKRIPISIIVPIYNVEPYIERCLKSVMAQSYTDIECILVDDCTPDHSMDICERMIAEYSGSITFKILHHDHNRGLSAARNTGTNAASGEYIYYLDSDDEIIPDCIMLMVSEISKHPDIELVLGNRQGDNNLKIETVPCFMGSSYHTDNIWFKYQSFREKKQLPVTAWNKLISVKFLKKNKIHFIEGIIFEDQPWNFALASTITNVATVKQRTYIYHPTPNSITNGTPYHKSAEGWLILLNTILPNIKQPLLLLQTLYFLSRFLEWYHGIPRRKYEHVAQMFFLLLCQSHHYLLALETYVFLRFNRSLKLIRFEPLYLKQIHRLYVNEEKRLVHKHPQLRDCTGESDT